MKRALIVAVLLLVAVQASATYIVVLKDGTQYKAKEKWTVTNGKARINLENGQILELDPSLIDAAKSEASTKAGVSNARILDLTPNVPVATPQQQQKQNLGSSIHIKRPGDAQAAKPAETTAAATPKGPTISTQALEKFELAYENVGIFEHKMTPTGLNSLRAELTADNEDKVFNAITATAFLMMRNAGVNGTQIEMVELFMKQTNGGASGRFQMTRADAQALDAKTTSVQDYFVHKVIY